MNKYDEIINLPHYEPKNHLRLSMKKRAGQFAPFSALTGYDEKVKEKARLTDKKIDISEDEKIKINNSLNYIKENIKNRPYVKIKYFKKDDLKDGGKYYIVEGNVKKIIEDENKIYFENGEIILFENIIKIILNIEK